MKTTQLTTSARPAADGASAGVLASIPAFWRALRESLAEAREQQRAARVQYPYIGL